EGHIWGSMRRMAFILGSGLLLLMAHWNCVTGHLQRFWGVSGYFWQAQWERLLSTFEGKESNSLLISWLQSPSAVILEPRKIKSATLSTVGPMKLCQSILMILFNQFVISLPMLVSLYPILKLWGDPCLRECPTFHWFLLELVVFTLIKLSHFSRTVPIAATCLSVHPVEHVHTSLRHPPLPSRVDQCYGALGMLDYRHGTDTVFKQAKAYKRHMILLGFTPLSESIPDPLKMMD
ncbi:hypothetical protein FD755_000639, partial [Muntiacus reevesi]